MTVLKGWSDIYSNYKEGAGSESFKDLKVTFTNYQINIYENTALIYHDIDWSGKYNREDFSMKQKRVGHLVKKGGKWKFDFLSMMTIPDASNN